MDGSTFVLSLIDKPTLCCIRQCLVDGILIAQINEIREQRGVLIRQIEACDLYAFRDHPLNQLNG